MITTEQSISWARECDGYVRWESDNGHIHEGYEFSEVELTDLCNLAYAKGLEDAGKWVSTTERHPEGGQSRTVLVCCGGLVGIGGWDNEFGWWLTGADFDDEPVSHWKPLPTALKGEPE